MVALRAWPRAIVCGLVLLVAAVAAQGAEEKRPNIVLIYADDLGWGDVSFNGRTSWRTENLDALAKRGTQFQRWYTAAVVCAPSRGALLTGKSTIHSGVSRNNDDLPDAMTTIAEALKANGYATALFGKWHHGAPRKPGTDYVHPMDQGFDEFFGFTDAVHAWEKFPRWLWDGREKVDVKGHSDDMFTDKAIAYLKRPKDRPFFLYLPYISAHFNIEAPADEVALHRGKFREDDPAKPLNATYAAMITRFDRNAGRVVKAIDELGLAPNTVIVFTSDHGATFEKGNQGTCDFHDSNGPFRGQKRTLWEGGIRVPGVVVWPGKVPAGKVSGAVIHMTDLFPTFLALAGVKDGPALQGLDGQDQSRVWTGESAPVERTLFWEWRNEGWNQIAAMRGALKLVITNGGRPELFDVVADPAERRNIIAQHPELAKELGLKLKEWLATEAKF